MSQGKQANSWPLIGGVAAAIAASLCCVGPLVLVMLGIGGAWIANLAVLEPYRPFFLGIGVVFMVFAYGKFIARLQRKTVALDHCVRCRKPTAYTKCCSGWWPC